MTPYFESDGVQLFLGDCRDILPALGLEADVVIADPPYGETSLAWDRWPDGWPAHVWDVTRQLWCFGSMRMFLEHGGEFHAAGWRFAQDVVWKKHTGTGFQADRFRRVHELAVHWYRGDWRAIYKDPQRELRIGPAVNHPVRRSPDRALHMGSVGSSTWVDDGTRLVQSVISASTLRGKALHPTEKPAGILRPIIGYSSPVGGLVVDPFAGSGSTLVVAREMGRRAIGIENREKYCEVIARRLAAAPLPLEPAG